MDPEILGHYERGEELERLAGGSSRIESRGPRSSSSATSPRSPARVVDVGGGSRAYAMWLAGRGYEVTLVDPVPMHVNEPHERRVQRARSPRVSVTPRA